MAFKWNRNQEDIARLIPKNSIRGVLKKDIILQPNEEVVMLQDGEIKDVLTGGRARIGGLLKPASYLKDTDIIFIDTSPKDLQWEIGELWTQDTQKIGCKGLIRFRVSDAKRLFNMLFTYTTPDERGERCLTIHNLYEHIKSEVLTRVLEPVISSKPIDELYGNLTLQHQLENQLDIQLNNTLQMWGMELQKLTTQWDFKDYARVREEIHEHQIGEELGEIETSAQEGSIERDTRVKLARIRADHSTISTVKDFEREQQLKEVKAQLERERLEDEADIKAATEALKLKEQLHLTKARGRRAELEVEQDMKEREHKRDIEYIKTLTQTDPETAKTITQGRELGKLTPAQIEAIAKVRESEARAKEDKLAFMKEIEDRERQDAYRRQELDAKLMNAAKPVASGTNVKKCPHCGATVPMQAGFCGECGSKL